MQHKDGNKIDDPRKSRVFLELMRQQLGSMMKADRRAKIEREITENSYIYTGRSNRKLGLTGNNFHWALGKILVLFLFD